MCIRDSSNATVKAQNNNFITNEETVGDLVVSKVIYRLDGSLYRHIDVYKRQHQNQYGGIR